VRILAAVAIPVLWSNLVLPRLRLGLRGRTAANATFATGYAVIFGAHGNSRRSGSGRCVPPSTIRGLLWGAALSAPILAGYAALLAVPTTRRRLAEFAAREPEVGLAEWITIHIPLGTVYSEELIFRVTLDPMLNRHNNALVTWIGPTAFGLWHIAPARAADDSVPGTVALTALGGLVLSRLRRHTRGTIAPVSLHLALNIGGAVAPHLADHLSPRTRRN
jgi:uncharacterized protein